MNIAIETSPIDERINSYHTVRGTGFYIKNLLHALEKYYPDNTYISFSKTLSNSTIDIVHYPYFEPFFLTLPLFKKYKTVVTVHDLTPLVFPDMFPSGLKGTIKWFIQKILLEQSTRIITDSESSRKDIITYTGIKDDQIDVIYLAASEDFHIIENTELLNRVKKKYGLPTEFILYVGDVTPNKNIPNLIKAVKKTGIPLVLVGKVIASDNKVSNNIWNNDLITIRQLIKNEKNIHTIGFVPSDDLCAIYNVATIFLMPSLYEGFGLPVLESMMCGCPVITTKKGSLPEVAGDAAYYIDPNMDNIHDGIMTLHANKELRKELSNKGSIQAKKFSWKITADKTVAVYKNMVSSSI